jgi:2-oxoglutarate ferredoxin oxidoreductase subunit beta
MDITYLVMDNEVYGMTKGQASPTTPPDWDRSKLTPHGTGVRRFQPAAIALAAGAGFIARGFAGDPAGLSRLLCDAIRHPGFAFVHVLSPCRTFRPDQQVWKERVHPATQGPAADAAHAAEQILRDDGMALGVLYAQPLPVYRPCTEGTVGLEQIEAELTL